MAYKYSYDYEKEKYEFPKLRTDRNVWKVMILNILTGGIYGIFFFTPLSYDLDKINPKREQEKTMSFLFAYVLSSPFPSFSTSGSIIYQVV